MRGPKRHEPPTEPLTLREWETLPVGGEGLREREADRLHALAERPARRLKLPQRDVLTRTRKGLRAGQIVGVLAIPGRTVEILPKIEGENSAVRQGADPHARCGARPSRGRRRARGARHAAARPAGTDYPAVHRAAAGRRAARPAPPLRRAGRQSAAAAREAPRHAPGRASRRLAGPPRRPLRSRGRFAPSLARAGAARPDQRRLPRPPHAGAPLPRRRVAEHGERRCAGFRAALPDERTLRAVRQEEPATRPCAPFRPPATRRPSRADRRERSPLRAAARRDSRGAGGARRARYQVEVSLRVRRRSASRHRTSIRCSPMRGPFALRA